MFHGLEVGNDLWFVDTRDLEGYDFSYNKGTHSSTNFCVQCETECKDGLFEDTNVMYRNEKRMNEQIQLYKQAVSGTISLSGLTELQYSKGIKGKPGDTYPGASRIIPPTLHMDIGITSKTLEMNTNEMRDKGDINYHKDIINESNIKLSKQAADLNARAQEIDELKYALNKYQTSVYRRQYVINQKRDINKRIKSLQKQYAKRYQKFVQHEARKKKSLQQIPLLKLQIYSMYKKQMKNYGIYRSRYFSSLEGNQCKKYRKNWNDINKHWHESGYYKYNKIFMNDLNRIFQIISQSKPLLLDAEITELTLLVSTLKTKWLKVKEITKTEINMPPKFHYIKHNTEWCSLSKTPSGYLMEPWLEGLHVIFNDCRRSYLNQKGILITSSKYSKSYTNGKSNK